MTKKAKGTSICLCVMFMRLSDLHHRPLWPGRPGSTSPRVALAVLPTMLIQLNAGVNSDFASPGNGVRKVAGLLIFGGWKLPSCFVANYVVSFVEPNKVLIVIIILIVIDARARRPPRRPRPQAETACGKGETCGSPLAKHLPQARRPCAPPGNPS